MNTAAMFSNKSNEWATPQAFFEELNNEFHFTLDPCSTHENAKCVNHYTVEDDGLSKNWGGANSFLQSSVWPRIAKVGQKMLR